MNKHSIIVIGALFTGLSLNSSAFEKVSPPKAHLVQVINKTGKNLVITTSSPDIKYGYPTLFIQIKKHSTQKVEQTIPLSVTTNSYSCQAGAATLVIHDPYEPEDAFLNLNLYATFFIQASQPSLLMRIDLTHILVTFSDESDSQEEYTRRELSEWSQTLVVDPKQAVAYGLTLVLDGNDLERSCFEVFLQTPSAE